MRSKGFSEEGRGKNGKCLTNIHGRNGMVISSMFSMPKQRNCSFDFPMEKSFKILNFPAPSWSSLSGPSRNRSSGCKKVFNNAPKAFWIPAFAGMTEENRAARKFGQTQMKSRFWCKNNQKQERPLTLLLLIRHPPTR
jgi:hypothetical protein